MTAQLRHQFRRYARRRQNLQPFFDGQLGNIGPHQGSERILGRNAAEAVALLRTYIDAVHRGRVRIYIVGVPAELADQSEEHTSELQSLMRISYAVFCLKKKKNYNHI